MLNASRRWNLFAWLLCVLIISASLDRVADPPAINPHGPDIKALCFHHTVQSASGYSCVGHGLLSIAGVAPSWLVEIQSFRTELPGLRPIEVQHASGTSPPLYFPLFLN
jgi:hypothetical protein